MCKRINFALGIKSLVSKLWNLGCVEKFKLGLFTWGVGEASDVELL